jgi:hypothetical protein
VKIAVGKVTKLLTAGRKKKTMTKGQNGVKEKQQAKLVQLPLMQAKALNLL